jgi:hypothetical protein
MKNALTIVKTCKECKPIKHLATTALNSQSQQLKVRRAALTALGHMGPSPSCAVFFYIWREVFYILNGFLEVFREGFEYGFGERLL